VSYATKTSTFWVTSHFRDTKHRASEALAGVYYWAISTAGGLLGHGVRCPVRVASRITGAMLGCWSGWCVLGTVEMSLIVIKGRRALLCIPFFTRITFTQSIAIIPDLDIYLFRFITIAIHLQTSISKF
jgi:hypothetical protein